MRRRIHTYPSRAYGADASTRILAEPTAQTHPHVWKPTEHTRPGGLLHTQHKTPPGPSLNPPAATFFPACPLPTHYSLPAPIPREIFQCPSIRTSSAARAVSSAASRSRSLLARSSSRRCRSCSATRRRHTPPVNGDARTRGQLAASTGRRRYSRSAPATPPASARSRAVTQPGGDSRTSARL